MSAPWWCGGPARPLTGALLVIGLFAGTASARPWAKWAPAPLASDSAFAAFSARPVDSLGIGELTWLGVQRDWRQQRLEESVPVSRSITTTGRMHRARPDDERFAELAARRYEDLTDQQRAWLVTESAEQREDRGRTDESGAGLAFLVGLAAGVVGLTYALDHAMDHLGSSR